MVLVTYFLMIINIKYSIIQKSCTVKKDSILLEHCERSQVDVSSHARLGLILRQMVVCRLMAFFKPKIMVAVTIAYINVLL